MNSDAVYIGHIHAMHSYLSEMMLCYRNDIVLTVQMAGIHGLSRSLVVIAKSAMVWCCEQAQVKENASVISVQRGNRVGGLLCLQYRVKDVISVELDESDRSVQHEERIFKNVLCGES